MSVKISSRPSFEKSRRRSSRMRAVALPAIFALSGLAPAAQALLLPGDSVVVDATAGTDEHGALFAVKRAGGKRILLNDFGDGTQGPIGLTPAAAAFESFSSVVAVDLNGGTNLRGALYRIDTLTGKRTLLSDFGDSLGGPLGANPSGIAVEKSGQLLVVDPSAGDADHRGRLFRIDPGTGLRTVLSNFNDATQGPKGITPSSVSIDADGKILVVDASVVPNVAGVVFKIDPVTGVRTPLSNFSDPAQGPVGGDPATLAVEPSGSLLVVDPGDHFTGTGGGLYRIDALSGVRTRISDFADAGQGPVGASPLGVGVQANGKILITDADADLDTGTEQRGALFSVDPVSGERKTLSDFADPGQGPQGNDPVAVVPVPGIPLKQFKFTVQFDPIHHLLWIRGRFGIDLKGISLEHLKAAVQVRLGTLTQLIPPNACTSLGGKAFKCEGQIAGSTFALVLRPLGKKQFGFYIVASGIDVAKLKQAIPFSLSLGERVGGGTIKLPKIR